MARVNIKELAQDLATQSNSLSWEKDPKKRAQLIASLQKKVDALDGPSKALLKQEEKALAAGFSRADKSLGQAEAARDALLRPSGAFDSNAAEVDRLLSASMDEVLGIKPASRSRGKTTTRLAAVSPQKATSQSSPAVTPVTPDLMTFDRFTFKEWNALTDEQREAVLTEEFQGDLDLDDLPDIAEDTTDYSELDDYFAQLDKKSDPTESEPVEPTISEQASPPPTPKAPSISLDDIDSEMIDIPAPIDDEGIISELVAEDEAGHLLAEEQSITDLDVGLDPKELAGSEGIFTDHKPVENVHIAETSPLPTNRDAPENKDSTGIVGVLKAIANAIVSGLSAIVGLFTPSTKSSNKPIQMSEIESLDISFDIESNDEIVVESTSPAINPAAEVPQQVKLMPIPDQKPTHKTQARHDELPRNYGRAIEVLAAAGSDYAAELTTIGFKKDLSHEKMRMRRIENAMMKVSSFHHSSQQDKKNRLARITEMKTEVGENIARLEKKIAEIEGKEGVNAASKESNFNPAPSGGRKQSEIKAAVQLGRLAKNKTETDDIVSLEGKTERKTFGK